LSLREVNRTAFNMFDLTPFATPLDRPLKQRREIAVATKILRLTAT
jgi:hypothetical protein